MITFAEAVLSLSPNASFTTDGETIISWESEDEQPTEEQIIKKMAELEYEREVKSYQTQRYRAYPNIREQLDKIFHEGIDAWKAEIQTIKDAYPKVEVDVNTLQQKGEDAWNSRLFDRQLKEYKEAIVRLSRVEKATGREAVPEVTEEVLVEDWDENGVQKTTTVVVERAIPEIAPVEPTVTFTNDEGEEQTIENPVITQDNAERAAAQAIIDATPQVVIDAYNSGE